MIITKVCFPNDYKKIETLAYILILEVTNAITQFVKFSKTLRHPYSSYIP